MKRKTSKALILLFIFLLTLLIPITVSADTGPKPSVQVTINGLGDAPCYATLLSKTPSTGPASVWSGKEDEIRHNNAYEFDRKIWDAFTGYKDPDGFYFLQWSWKVNETKEFRWSYYPPSEFKILLYFPEQDQFCSSDILERYAFDSYFTVNIISGQSLEAVKSYNYTLETVSLVARIVITIALELGIAWLFAFRGKKQLGLLLIVNVITQVALNVALNLANYHNGQQAFVSAYIGYELLVFALEAAIYCIFLTRNRERQPKECIAYAFVANLISFLAGFGIAKLIPGIF